MAKFCEEKSCTYDEDKLIKHKVIFLREDISNAKSIPRIFVCCKECAELFNEFHLPRLKQIIQEYDDGTLSNAIEYKNADACLLFPQREKCGKILHSIYFDENRSAGQKKGFATGDGSTCCYDWFRELQISRQD